MKKEKMAQKIFWHPVAHNSISELIYVQYIVLL